ncbi:unnamed protein product [Acidithrix sp. C25]|nr:unnamed protein product [Acidithrix sp. C25]
MGLLILHFCQKSIGLFHLIFVQTMNLSIDSNPYFVKFS